MNCEPLRDFENDYEIEIETPHRIRKRSNERIVSQCLEHLRNMVVCQVNGGVR